MLVDVQETSVKKIGMPTDQAMMVLRGSRYDRTRGLFIYQGRPLSSRELIRRANEILKSKKQDPIEYPGI